MFDQIRGGRRPHPSVEQNVHAGLDHVRGQLRVIGVANDRLGDKIRRVWRKRLVLRAEIQIIIPFTVTLLVTAYSTPAPSIQPQRLNVPVTLLPSLALKLYF